MAVKTMVAAYQTSGRYIDRHKVNQRVLVINSLRDQLLGNIVNVHEEGFMLIGNKVPLTDSGVYQLTFQFLSPVLGRQEITLGGECLWVRETSDDQYWAGFQIIDISDEDKKVVASLCEQI